MRENVICVDNEGKWLVDLEHIEDKDGNIIEIIEHSRVPYLTEKKQELQNRIVELESRIVELEKLEARILELESK